MSLLLDALKKAAEDKQKADSAIDPALESGTGAPADDVRSAESMPDPANLPAADTADPSQPIEFELEDEALSLDVEATLQSDQHVESQPETLAPDKNSTPIAATPSTVTDEALQLLIRKTNDEYQKSRRLIWGSVATGTVVLLALGGLYFYTGMTGEIEMMQRKHQIALTSLRAKTRIEENLTSLAVAPEAKAQSGQQDSNAVGRKQPVNSAKVTGKVRGKAAVNNKAIHFSVQRSEKQDPVSVLLNRAWNAYQEQEYDIADQTYRRALEKEPDNHDALLGVAAVAMQKQDITTAREAYIKLLERDPRDSHAHAGLANIAQLDGTNLSETRLKQLIEYRPDNSHLQFALGNLYVQKKSWPEAQHAFFNALKSDSKNPDYAYNLAISLDHLGKYQEAKVYYQDSLRLAAGKNISFSTGAVQKRIALLAARY